MAVLRSYWSTRCFGAGGVGKRPWRCVEPRAKWPVCLGARAAEAGSCPAARPQAGQSDNRPTTMARRTHEHRCSPITCSRTPDTNSNEGNAAVGGAAAGYSRPWVMAAARVILSPGISTRLRASAEKLAERLGHRLVLKELGIVLIPITARGRTQAAALVRSEVGIAVRPAAMGETLRPRGKATVSQDLPDLASSPATTVALRCA